MDVAPRFLHHSLDVVAAFANNVGVLRVGHVHLQSYPVALVGREEEGQGEKAIHGARSARTSKHKLKK